MWYYGITQEEFDDAEALIKRLDEKIKNIDDKIESKDRKVLANIDKYNKNRQNYSTSVKCLRYYYGF